MADQLRSAESRRMEETFFLSEQRAAATALASWVRMLGRALEPEPGEEEGNTLNILQRVRSLDAAWARFDKAHVR